MQFTLVSVLALASAALAITVTSPAKDAQWDLSGDNKISWASVSTDPTKVNIILVNMAVNPSVQEVIASNIDVSSGSYDLKGLKNSPSPGGAYQINLENANQPGAILAQSQQFSVEKPAANSESTAAATGTLVTASSTSKSAASTLSKAASESSSSASASASASASSASASASASSSSSASTSASASAASGSKSNATTSATSSSSTGAASGMVAHKELTGLGALVMGALMFFA